MSLVWREQLSVGNDLIDADHKHLINVINRIERSMKARDGNELQAAIDDLASYSKEHFAREEKIAHAAGYSQINHLSLSHEMLLGELDKTKRETSKMIQDWSPDAVEHLTKFLRSWLIEHVIKEDLLMKPVLQKHPASFGAK